MSLVQNIKDKVTQFVDVRLNLVKLTVIERSSSVLGYLIYTFILLFLVLAVFLFLGIGLQEWFSELVDSRIGGAFMTMGFYVLLILLAFVLRKKILAGFAGIFISILTAQDPDDEEYEERPHGKKIPVED
jgi:uncharacterized protein YqhQ